MATKKDKKHDKIAEAIGASRVIQLKAAKSGGPLDWLELTHSVQRRLISRGGRPSDPQWDTKRLVPFKSRTWKRLRKEAETISEQGRKVGPAQLAAMVIERGVIEIDQNISKEAIRLPVLKMKGQFLQLSNTACIDITMGDLEVSLSEPPEPWPISEIADTKRTWTPNINPEYLIGGLPINLGE